MVLFCPGWRMDVTKRFSALGNGVKLVNFPDWRNTSNLWHIKHRGGSHLMIQPTSGKAAQLYKNPKPPAERSPPRPVPVPGFRALRPAPSPRGGGDGSREGPAFGRSGLAEETPPGRALRPGERVRQQRWRKGKRRRRRRAAGELRGCGRPPSRSSASPPHRGRGERGRNAPPALSLPPGPAVLGACAGWRREPPQASAAAPAPPGGKGPVKTRARHKTRALPRLEPGGRSGLNDSFNMR